MQADQLLAVVTGAGSGIGRATALELAGSGMAVAAADLSEQSAEQTAALAGQHVTPFHVDVTDPQSVDRLATTVRDQLGVPWALVNCAGWDELRPFLETDRAFWERIVQINLLGVVAVTHAFLPAMVERERGRIVNVASDAGRVGSSGESVYAGAKGGVIAFTKSLARELARHRITANAVCPGPTDTPLLQSFPERAREALLRAIPMRHLGEPGDVAHAIGFFASERAGYITGQVLSVSGGLTMSG